MSYDHVGILSVILCANRVCHFAESRLCQDRSLEVCSYRSFEWVPLCVAVWQNCDQQFRWTGLWYWFQDVHVPIRAKWQPESCDFFRFDVGPEVHPLRCFVFWVRQLYSGCPTGNLIAAPPNLRWEYKDPADASLCEVGSNALWQTIPHTGCQISMFRIVVDVLSWIFSRKMLFFYGRFRIAWYEHRIVTSDIPRH